MEWSVTYRIREINNIPCKIFPPSLNDCRETINMNMRNQKAYQCKHKMLVIYMFLRKDFVYVKKVKITRTEILAFGFNFTSKDQQRKQTNP